MLLRLPAGVDDAAIRKELLNNYGLEIGGGLGALAGKAWRIGLMGYAARKDNVVGCISALGEALHKQDQNIKVGPALDAVFAHYAGDLRSQFLPTSLLLSKASISETIVQCTRPPQRLMN